MFARSSRQYKKNVAQWFLRELKNRCKAPELPPYLVSRWCHLSPSWQHGRATRWLAVKATLGTSDCQGWLSALFKNRKKFVPFETKVCIPRNVFKRILHRSGRTSFSSQFRDPKSLLRLLTYRRRGLSASKAIWNR